MTVEKLKRILQRVRARNPGQDIIKRNELEQCIMIECGTCKATYFNNKRALVKLGWIKAYPGSKHKIEITGKDLTEDFI